MSFQDAVDEHDIVTTRQANAGQDIHREQLNKTQVKHYIFILTQQSNILNYYI